MTGEPGAAVGGRAAEPSQGGLLWLAVGHLRWLLGLPAAAALLVGLLVLRQHREYTASASFTVQQGASGSRLAGLAAQFGVGIPGQSTADSPDYYAVLLHSRGLLAGAVTFAYPVGRAAHDLMQQYGIHATAGALRLDKAETALRNRLIVQPDLKTGVIAIDVRDTSAAMAEAIAERLLRLVDSSSQERRRARAVDERVFLESRQNALTLELRKAQDRLTDFMLHNRAFRDAPALAAEHDRLEREAERLQALGTSIDQELEQARLDEVRNTPVITVVDAPQVPVVPDSRRVLAKAVFAAMVTFMATLAWLVARAATQHRLAADPELAVQLHRALRIGRRASH